jgi:phosphoenolpyruvate carboxykinase (GTP)
VPGTNRATNRNAFDMIHRDTLFTNVALTADNEPWWEGRKLNTPVLDWQGKPFDAASGGVSAHPNSRFTVSARNNPIYSPRSEDAAGVPISAIVFGGRRREVAPLVYEARSWQHGVVVGASVASETTAAATGAVGVVRRDPMAMKPFAGYNFGDYWRHWLAMGKRLKHPPRLFHVNWFRRDAAGKFLWPGFGDNLRVMEWILKRCAGQIGADDSPIGYLPKPADLNLSGANVSEGTMRELLAVTPDAWRKEAAEMRDYLKEFGTHAPEEMSAELAEIERRLG